MRVRCVGAVLCSLLAGMAWSQPNVPVGSEPSPMGAFAHGPGVHTTWSSEAGSLKHDDTSAVFTAVVLEDGESPARKMRGVKVDLLTSGDHEEIYLDEGATATRFRFV